MKRIVFAIPLWSSTASAAESVPAPDPPGVVGGTEASECQWPSVVQVETVVDGMTYGCTGVLVAPDIVLTAGHCLFDDTLPWVRFGENADTPVDVFLPESCERHPDFYDDPNGGSDFDLAICRLLGEPPPVPIVPLMAGCDADALAVDAITTVVGFGTNDEPTLSGAGIKRFSTMRIESVTDDEVVLRGIDGAGICYGDSGGPLLVAMPDGTWRVAAVSSTAHPDVFDCGYGAVHDRVDLVLPWLEQAAGRDLTPCHDADGTWNPDATCDAFPLAPDDGSTWARSCQGGASSDPGALCGPAFGDDDGTTTTGDDDGSGSDDSGSSVGESSTTGVVEGTDDGDPGSSESTATSAVDEFEPARTEGDDGCRCRSSPPPRSLLVAFVVLVSAGARRRRSE